MNRVGFVLKRESPEAEDIFRRLVAWVRGRGLDAVVAEARAHLADGVRPVAEDALGKECDLLVTLGGDGTLLHGAWLVADEGVPILGVNLGRLGFLTPFDRDDVPSALERALEGRLPTEERMRIAVRLTKRTGEVFEKRCLNDAVIAQREIARLLELEASLDGSPIGELKADGLIVSTPTGSTAYNLAAGGPILTPGHAAMAFTPICPHTLTHRPLVIHSHGVIEIQVTGEGQQAVLTLDGRWTQTVARGDRVRITRAQTPLRLFRSDKSYFEILREKLSWGQRKDLG